MRGWAWSWTAALTTTLTTAGFAAEERLGWTAPAACPSGAWAAQELETNLAGAEVGDFRARVTIHEAEDEFVVHIETERAGVSGERRLQGADCRELGEAAIVLLGMAAQGHSVTDEVAKPEAEAPVVAPAAEAPQELQEDSVHDGAPSAAWLVRPRLLIDGGALPSWAPGFGLDVAHLIGSGSVGLRGEFTLPVDADVEQPGVPPGVGGRFWGWDVLALGCWRVDGTTFGFDACAGAGFALSSGEGRGIDNPTRQDVPSPVFDAELGLAWRWSPALSLRLAATARVLPVRKTFAIDGIGPVFSPPPVSFRPSLGLEVRF